MIENKEIKDIYNIMVKIRGNQKIMLEINVNYKIA